MTSDVTQAHDRDADSTQPTRAPGLMGVLKRHVKFLGPGIVASAAYYDPGNWATDLQAGSQFGNIHLFVLLVAIILAIFLQILATRLGFVSRKDISQNCRDALYSRQSNRVKTRWLLLYPLWLLFEIGVLFADIGELLGSAIAYTLLIPQLPPWVAVLMTFPEVFLALLFFRGGKESKKSMKIFEIMITVVVMAVVVSALVLMFKVKPNFAKVFQGFIPSVKLATGTSFYTAIGIIGATIGPHSLILGAAMATQDRSDDEDAEHKAKKLAAAFDYVDPSAVDPEKQPEYMSSKEFDVDAVPRLSLTHTPPPKQRTVLGCKSYLAHASFDIAASIFTLPLIVNSAILVVASTSFFFTKTPGMTGDEEADIASMHTLLKTKLGTGLATLFALSLLLSGQAASLTVTMAGQSVSAGFLDYETNPLVRRLITRTIGIIPSAIVSALLGRKGISDMLIASQVAISIVLPFTVIPLAYFTGKKEVMSIPIPQERSFSHTELESTRPPLERLDSKSFKEHLHQLAGGYDESQAEFTPTFSFANSMFVKVIVGVLIIVVLLANIYGIYQAISEAVAK